MIKFLQKSEFGGKEEKKIILQAAITAIILAMLDQASKAVVVAEFTLGESITIIPGFFNLTYITNKGAAWGILHGKIWLLMLISTVVFVLIIWQIRTLTEGWNERYFAMAVIISGIIGNSIDRIWRKEVVDFLDFYIRVNDKSYSWPAFNIADSAITVGVIIYIASTLFRKSPNKNTVQTEDSSPAE
ncbi:MAG: signal peptidase II [Victivallales bacterium]|nr:signal peptidase II [Victivallales bacterium]